MPSPVPRPGKIVGVGLNYRQHVAELGEAIPSSPLLFMKPSSSVIGDGDPIVVDPAITAFADWEVELAVVIGRRLLRPSRREVPDAIAGYAVANDVTARDIQRDEGQWFRAKSPDTFCPLGAWVPAAAVADPQDLVLRARLNGVVVQESTTADMVFGVHDLVAFCAASFALEPGDVILTGTPSGVGMSMDPPRPLRPGDVIEVEIPGVGRLSNPVVDVTAVARAGGDEV